MIQEKVVGWAGQKKLIPLAVSAGKFSIIFFKGTYQMN
jgi:hypothetical protein